eukprot:COSAG02_NODE_4217_length_5620_cov_17.851476_2_plen_52_part_00
MAQARWTDIHGVGLRSASNELLEHDPTAGSWLFQGERSVMVASGCAAAAGG